MKFPKVSHLLLALSSCTLVNASLEHKSEMDGSTDTLVLNLASNQKLPSIRGRMLFLDRKPKMVDWIDISASKLKHPSIRGRINAAQTERHLKTDLEALRNDNHRELTLDYSFGENGHVPTDELFQPVPEFEFNYGSSLEPSAGPSLAPSTIPSLEPSAGPSLAPSTIPSLEPSATSSSTHTTAYVSYLDMNSKLVSYVDHGSCGPRGDDAVADLSICPDGRAHVVKSLPWSNWEVVHTDIHNCDYFEVTAYECADDTQSPLVSYLFDTRSPLVSYVDHGNCGPRGDDAVADFSECIDGEAHVVKSLPFSNWEIVYTDIHNCDYFAVTVYECTIGSTCEQNNAPINVRKLGKQIGEKEKAYLTGFIAMKIPRLNSNHSKATRCAKNWLRNLQDEELREYYAMISFMHKKNPKKYDSKFFKNRNVQQVRDVLVAETEKKTEAEYKDEFDLKSRPITELLDLWYYERVVPLTKMRASPKSSHLTPFNINEIQQKWTNYDGDLDNLQNHHKCKDSMIEFLNAVNYNDPVLKALTEYAVVRTKTWLEQKGTICCPINAKTEDCESDDHHPCGEDNQGISCSLDHLCWCWPPKTDDFFGPVDDGT